MSADWPLMRRIRSYVADHVAMDDEEIAEALGESLPVVRQPLRIMYRRHQVDLIWGYVCLPSPPAEGRSA